MSTLDMWRKITTSEDSLPPEKIDVLLTDGEFIDVGYWRERICVPKFSTVWFMHSGGDYGPIFDTPTHWMSLPELPKT